MSDNQQKQQRNQRPMNFKFKWVVSPHRKDKRTGALDPVPMDKYTKYAFDEVDRFFHGDKANYEEGVIDEEETESTNRES